MKLDYNSWHAKLYRFFNSDMYESRMVNMVNNLCPYFWSFSYIIPLTILGILFAIPYLIIAHTLNFFTQALKLRSLRLDTGDKLKDIALNSLGSYAIIVFSLMMLAITSYIYLFYFGYLPKISKDTLMISTAINILWIILILNFVFKYFNKKRKKLLEEKIARGEEQTVSFFGMFKAYIKGKYHKYCPKVEWVNKK